MKAIVLERPGEFRMADVPEPDRPGPGEALVRVHRVGVCGTDYSGYLGKMPFFSYPRIPGHELGVEVAEVGAGVENVKPGDRCAVEPYINCQRCFACQRGHTNCCENHQTLGVHRDGGLCPWFLVPARKLHPSSRLNYESLALVETLAIGRHAIERGAAKPAENVVIIGAGPIGLSVIEFAKLSGARVIVIDLAESRLRFVRESMGVGDVISAKGDGSELDALTRLTDGKLGQLVIDATGSDASMSQALNYVGFAGRLVYVGITTKEVRFPHPLLHRREMTLLASRNALAADFREIIRLIEDERLDVRPWLTHRADMSEMIEAFPDWLRPETGVIKAMVAVH